MGLTEMTQSATGFFRALSAVSFSLVRSMAVTCSMLNTFSSSMYVTCEKRQRNKNVLRNQEWLIIIIIILYFDRAARRDLILASVFRQGRRLMWAEPDRWRVAVNY